MLMVQLLLRILLCCIIMSMVQLLLRILLMMYGFVDGAVVA